MILNGSINVDVGAEAFGVYAATKAAPRSFARTWADELKGRGIRVNTITPGPTDTPCLSGLPPDPGQAAALKQHLATQVPLGRLGGPEEIAAAVTFLASEQSSFITGSSLYVDGGLMTTPLPARATPCSPPWPSPAPTGHGCRTWLTGSAWCTPQTCCRLTPASGTPSPLCWPQAPRLRRPRPLQSAALSTAAFTTRLDVVPIHAETVHGRPTISLGQMFPRSRRPTVRHHRLDRVAMR
ncbi:SDR family oxidoreductase [Nonomuraea pusilla]